MSNKSITPLPVDVRGTESAYPVRYSICSLVTDRAMYERMVVSFLDKGFDAGDCEFLYLDNSAGNGADAYRGLNGLMNRARGCYLILCHQDLLLIDGRRKLDEVIAAMEAFDPDWAVLGNAGGVAAGQLAIRITDPHGSDTLVGDLPARVFALDENFLLVRASARLGFSRDLKGFHFYGADLCLQADMRGHSCYVIDFHLQHLSGGNKSLDFHICQEQMQRKYARALRTRWLQTTCGTMLLSGHPVVTRLPFKLRDRFAALARRLGGRSESVANGEATGARHV